MNIKNTAKVAFQAVRKVSPLIFAGAAVIGVGVTTYLAVKESRKGFEIKDKLEGLKKTEETKDIRKEKAKTRFDLILAYRWAILSGVGTIGCIAASTAISWIRLKNTTEALIATEKIFEKYKQAVLATGASTVAIGEEMAKESRNDIPKEVMDDDDDDKILVYDMSNDVWLRTREADIYRAIIYLNEILDTDGYASVEDFYKVLECAAPLGSSIRGWYTWSDEWFNYHDGTHNLRFELTDGHKTDDGLEYWLFAFYDDPLYHTELGATMDECIQERRELFNMSEQELEEYRNHDC